MNYSETIEKLNPIFESNGFKMIESFKNFTKYESAFVALHLGFDELENSFSIFVGKKDGFLTELYEKVYIDFFGEELQSIDGATFSEKFIKFLTGKGNAILKGDLKKLDELEAYSLRAAEVYTTNLINQQNIDAADNA